MAGQLPGCPTKVCAKASIMPRTWTQPVGLTPAPPLSRVEGAEEAQPQALAELHASQDEAFIPPPFLLERGSSQQIVNSG